MFVKSFLVHVPGESQDWAISILFLEKNTNLFLVLTSLQWKQINYLDSKNVCHLH
jgi:hypothetical protein